MSKSSFRLHTLAAAVGALLSCNAFAQTAAPAAPASPVTFNIALTSNYKFRGQDQDLGRTSQFKPALQGGFDFAHPSGFYIGNWNSTVNFLEVTTFPAVPNKANLEVDIYGGYKFNLGDVGMDVGALTYIYPSASKANTTELYVAATVGPVTAKYSTTVSKDYFSYGAGVNNARGTGYLNLSVAQEVAPNVTLKASIGSTMFSGAIRNSGVSNFVDYSIGASYDFGDGLSLAGALQGASNKNSFNYVVGNSIRSANRDTLIFTLTKSL
jgi:uncharacterized protein (TIGR02001 family)